jgi:hypothetical protein
MEGRKLLAGLAVLALSLFVLSGTALAHTTHHKKARPHEGPVGGGTPETCVVHALPSSFMDQGEFDNASSVADIIEVECEDVFAEKYVRISANELYSRCDNTPLDPALQPGAQPVRASQSNSTTTATRPRSCSAGPRVRRAKA